MILATRVFERICRLVCTFRLGFHKTSDCFELSSSDVTLPSPAFAKHLLAEVLFDYIKENKFQKANKNAVTAKVFRILLGSLIKIRPAIIKIIILISASSSYFELNSSFKNDGNLLT